MPTRMALSHFRDRKKAKVKAQRTGGSSLGNKSESCVPLKRCRLVGLPSYHQAPDLYARD